MVDRDILWTKISSMQKHVVFRVSQENITDLEEFAKTIGELFG